jgi:hypothetical protein
MAPKISWVRVNEIYYTTNCHFKTMIQGSQFTVIYGYFRKPGIDHYRGGIRTEIFKREPMGIIDRGHNTSEPKRRPQPVLPT